MQELGTVLEVSGKWVCQGFCTELASKVFPPKWRHDGVRGAKLRPRWDKLRPRRAKIEPRWGQNEAKRDQKSRPKAIQSRSRMLIALERAPRGSRGSAIRNFRRVLGGILATNREPNAAFWEHFQPKVACWRQKSGSKNAFEKRSQETSPKCPQEAPKRNHFGCLVGHFAPLKAP